MKYIFSIFVLSIVGLWITPVYAVTLFDVPATGFTLLWQESSGTRENHLVYQIRPTTDVCMESFSVKNYSRGAGSLATRINAYLYRKSGSGVPVTSANGNVLLSQYSTDISGDSTSQVTRAFSVASSSCVYLSPSETYWVALRPNVSEVTGTLTFDINASYATGLVMGQYGLFDNNRLAGSVVSGSFASTTETAITYIYPEHGTTVTSPLAFRVDYNVNADDLPTIQKLYLGVRITHVDQPADDDFYFETVELTSSGSGTWTYSTSTPNGSYLMRAVIYKKLFGLLTTTQFDKEESIFAIGAHSVYGQMFLNNVNFVNQPASSTVAYIWDTCILDLINCAVHIVVPTSQQWVTLYSSLRDSVIQKPPLGYVNILVNAMIASSSESLPNITLTVPPGLPKAGNSIEVINWYDDFGSSSPLNVYLSTSTSKTFWQIVSGPIDTLLYLMTGISALFMVVKFRP